MKPPLKFLAIFLALSASSRALAEEGGDDPLRITIRPSYETPDKDSILGESWNGPTIENLGPCPLDQILPCDVTDRFWGEKDKIKSIIAGYAYERSKLDWQGPSLGLLMGGRYARLPDYKIMAMMGVDPGLDPLWPFPQAAGAMYGSLWFADTFNLGDRIAGPIMLTRGGPTQIELLGGERKHFSGN